MSTLPATRVPARAPAVPAAPETRDASPYAEWAALPGRVARLAKERSEAEGAVRAAFAAATRRAEADLAEGLGRAERRKSQETEDLAQVVGESRAAALGEFEQAAQAAEAERATLRRTAAARHRKRIDDAQKAAEATRWEVAALYETASTSAAEWRKEADAALADEAQTVETLRAETDLVLASYRGFLDPKFAPEPPPVPALDGDPFPPLHALVERVDAGLMALENLRIPRMFRGPRMAWVVILPLLALAYPAIWLLGLTAGPIVAAVLAIALGAGLRTAIVRRSRSAIGAIRGPLISDLAECDARVLQCRQYVAETFARRSNEATRRRDAELGRSETQKAEIVASANADRDTKVRDAEAAATRKLAEATDARDRALRQAEETERHRAEEIREQHAADLAAARSAHASAVQKAEAARRQAWDALASAWRDGMTAVAEAAAALRDEFLPEPTWPVERWKPPAALPRSIAVGRLALALDRVPGGLPDDPKLRAMAPESIAVPALLDFPARPSLLVEFAGEEGRAKAVEAMQGAMLRLLTSLPPAKVRFTILDPVGLGRGFSAFMHLADYAEALVNTRIWTEPLQFDHRLAELNSHIETVIQNYLRNEFATFEDYNEQAEEVAEPYRVLVVADFPAGFSESTARRLAAIAQSGPRCGVFLILSMDTSQPLPPSITKSDLRKGATRISWKGGRFVLRDPAYEPFALDVDHLPPNEAMSRLLRNVGEAARDANRVEVPFDVIAPRAEDYWKGDSRSGLSIPLGRAGATKLQPLMLGKGTSQHVLIAGRTGSGKSTLLHALITNSALIYGPDEVELYLIDFKKGVEFKTYATMGLPHARVIAIESEREFGISVLQRLDAVLKSRGDLYRDKGVQDVAGFRAACPDIPMPRVLLIVDEFQEFFVEDDKLAQEASLLLDRLVRQGRAFGIHVHLGSQTLGGAYALARSTLGQMAVRIALQCSESDAHLILNEDNAAARLLSRPGEAIYNDANGQVEGNHVFQVVWLSDSRKEAYLRAISALVKERGVTPRPTIVFEGNRPSDLSILPVFSSEYRPKSGPVMAWLGEAVAIKDPTAATFRAEGGTNLLVIGQDDEMAQGVASAAILGLAAQLPPESRFFLLDGTPDDSPFAGRLATLGAVVPQSFEVGGTRDAAKLLADVDAEVTRRQSEGGESVPWFVVIHDLPRFRDLRKQDDDFGFGRRGEEKAVPPSKRLGNILREGPPLGVHVILWCDSLNNVNRAFDRQGLREFEMRVLFQMSAADSSNLIDSPAANRLGPNRAFYANEGEGGLEKFRPFGPPAPELLDRLRSRWKAGG